MRIGLHVLRASDSPVGIGKCVLHSAIFYLPPRPATNDSPVTAALRRGILFGVSCGLVA